MIDAVSKKLIRLYSLKNKMNADLSSQTVVYFGEQSTIRDAGPHAIPLKKKVTLSKILSGQVPNKNYESGVTAFSYKNNNRIRTELSDYGSIIF